MLGLSTSYFNRYEERKIPFKEGFIDEFGIPVYNSIKFTQKKEYIYHPTVIIQYGLANFNQWKITGEVCYLNSFLSCCQWILLNAKWDNNNLFMQWAIPMKQSDLGHEAGWISALTQGQAISLLLRYLPFSDNDNYVLNVIKNALNSFYVDLSQGGITSTYPEGKFLQEAGNIRILNGCLTAFTGLMEYIEVYPEDSKAVALSKSVENAVTKFLPKYDLGFWSLYSLGFRFNISDLHYHRTHIDQLTYFGDYLNNKQFSYYATKWNTNLLNRKDVLLWKIARFLGLNFNRLLKVLGLSKFRFI